MLLLISILLIALLIILQLKISKISGKSADDSAQDQDSQGVEKIGRGINVELMEPPKESVFQKVLLGNIFNKIGAIAIIFALIFFIKLVSTMIVITPLVKMILSYLCGFAMVGAALNLHKNEKMKNYSEVLMGTGFATLFITTFCGYSLFKIFSPLYTILIGSVLLIATYFIADRMKTYSMIAIGLIGGYLTPFLSGVEAKMVLIFLVFLNMVSLVYTLRNKKIRLLNVFNLIQTVIIMMVYGILGTTDPLYPVLLWAAYIFYDILRDKSSAVDTAVCWINYFVLTIFTLWYAFDDKQTMAIVFCIAAIGYFMLSVLSRFQKTNLFKHYDHCVLVNIWLFIMIEATDLYSIIAWSLIGVVISYLISYHKCEYLKPAMWWYYASTFFAALIFNADNQWVLLAAYKPFINLRTLAFGIPVFSMAASSLIMRKDYAISSNFLRFSAFSVLYLYLLGEMNSLITYYSGNNGMIADIGFARLMIFIILCFVYSLHARLIYQRVGFELFNVMGIIAGVFAFLVLVFSSYFYPKGYMLFLNMRFAAYVIGLASFIAYVKWAKIDAFKYLAIILGFMLVHTESAGVKHLYGGDFQYLISLCWVLYAGIVTVAGIFRRENYLKITGIILSILAVLRILFVDLPTLDLVYKFIVFLALGVVFMLISYLYILKSKQ